MESMFYRHKNFEDIRNISKYAILHEGLRAINRLSFASVIEEYKLADAKTATEIFLHSLFELGFPTN